MVSIRTDNIARTLDGPSIVAAASALMLIPENSSKHVRLHRMAALGMALEDRQIPAASPSSVRALLKTDDIGGPKILQQEDRYSEVLVQSIDFPGGPYLVSPGSGEHTVADIENLIDGIFRERWMEDDLYRTVARLIQGFLIISDLVLSRAGLQRGTLPSGALETPVDVPGAAKLKELAAATFISSSDLESYGPWLGMMIDTFALDPGTISEPCGEGITDDRLQMSPFLRVDDGYRVVLPLELLVTLRFHLLRLTKQAGQLAQLGRRYRDAALHRAMRLVDPAGSAIFLEEDDLLARYLLPIDERRDLHIVVATDPLTDWETGVWDHMHGTEAVLVRLDRFMTPEERSKYSSASTVLHLVISDSPGGGSVWGVPKLQDADQILVIRSDDLEVILHHEPDGPLGLLLFAEAQDRRSGFIVATDILDEFSVYEASEKSFYLSDGPHADFTMVPPGEGLMVRSKFQLDADVHGVVTPGGPTIDRVRRRYRSDAPAIYISDRGAAFRGYVVELPSATVFITVDLADKGLVGVEGSLVECVAYWVWECSNHVGPVPNGSAVELVLELSSPEAWKTPTDLSQAAPAVHVSPRAGGFDFEITETFVALLQERDNFAERELVSAILENLFSIAGGDLVEVLDRVAPIGSKRMLVAFDQNKAPDVLATRLPRPLTGHSQVSAQLLDGLGQWLRSPSGGNYSTGAFEGGDRVEILNAAVRYLLARLESEIVVYEPRGMLTFLIAQNESLIHNAKFLELSLKSRIACFGENSEVAKDLVRERRTSASVQRANRFLIEYVAARPPTGTQKIQAREYYELLSIASEIAERGTLSDFLHYGLADFEVSILESGRLGVEADHPIHQAMETYAENEGARSVRRAQADGSADDENNESGAFDSAEFRIASTSAMKAEFGFTLDELREVCGGLLDLSVADQVTRIDRMHAIDEVSKSRGLSPEVVEKVLGAITLDARESFGSIGSDAFPWRFNRDMSYVRRPIVQQGPDVVFGFRGVYRLGLYWVDNLISGRFQGRAETAEMRKFITSIRRQANDQFAERVSRKLNQLGFSTRSSVRKIGKQRITDTTGKDIGDIDVFAFHEARKTIVAVEVKDFEIARTPSEIANEVDKLFTGNSGKRSAVELHERRVNWLSENIGVVAADLGLPAGAQIKVRAAIVTSDPLITPLVRESPFPVVAFEDLTTELMRILAGDEPSRLRRNRSR